MYLPHLASEVVGNTCVYNTWPQKCSKTLLFTKLGVVVLEVVVLEVLVLEVVVLEVVVLEVVVLEVVVLEVVVLELVLLEVVVLDVVVLEVVVPDSQVSLRNLASRAPQFLNIMFLNYIIGCRRRLIYP